MRRLASLSEREPDAGNPQAREVSEALSNAEAALGELADHALELQREAHAAESAAKRAGADADGVASVQKSLDSVEKHAGLVNQLIEDARGYLKDAAKAAAEAEAPEEAVRRGTVRGRRNAR